MKKWTPIGIAIIALFGILLLTQTVNAGDSTVFADVEFNAVVIEPNIPLGMQTVCKWFIWNRSKGAIEYAAPVVELHLRYRSVEAPTSGGEHLPPQYRTLGPGEFRLGGASIPDDTVFRSDLAGDYDIPVVLQLRKNGETETRKRLLKLTLLDKEPPEKFDVVPTMARDTWESGRRIEAYKLDDTAWRKNCSQVQEGIFQGATQDNMADWLARKGEYYDTPCGHDGFGGSEDRAETAVVALLETLLNDEYSMGELAYKIRFETSYQARRERGLAPMISLEHGVWVFREKGQAAALKYLDGLDTSSWDCVELAVRDWEREKIAAWQGRGKPRTLMYTREMWNHNLLIYDKKTGHYRLRKSE